MALANSTLITVTATYTRLDGRAASGQVFFSSNQVLVNSTSGEIVPPVDFVATLDANGAISIDLPATDDPDYEPQGWTYTVTEDTDGGDRPPFGLSVPADGGAIDLADVAPPGPTESLTADEYTLLSTFTSHRSAWGGDPPAGSVDDLIGLDANNVPKVIPSDTYQLNHIRDPREFGAGVGDGTDDLAAINAAINDLPADGGFVLVPGKLHVSDKVVFPQGVFPMGASALLAQIIALSGFAGDSVIEYQADTGQTHNRSVGGERFVVDCNQQTCHGTTILHGYDAVGFEHVRVVGTADGYSCWRGIPDPNHTDKVSQSMTFTGCQGTHASGTATAATWYFDRCNEMTFVNCKGWGGTAEATPAPAYEFRNCQGVTMLGGAAALSATGVRIVADGISAHGYYLGGVTFEGIDGDWIATSVLNGGIVNNPQVVAPRLQNNAGSMAASLGGLSGGRIETGLKPVTVESTCSYMTIVTRDRTQLTDNGDRTMVFAATDANNPTMGIGPGIDARAASSPRYQWVVPGQSRYWRWFWNASSSVNGALELQVWTGTAWRDVMTISPTGTGYTFYTGGVQRLAIDSSGVTTISGDLDHDGANAGFFGAAPVAQQTAPASLTDNSGGTKDNTVEAVSGSGADAAINNNFAEHTEELNQIRQALVNLGLWA